jgi:hypothetical protein
MGHRLLVNHHDAAWRSSTIQEFAAGCGIVRTVDKSAGCHGKFTD